MSLTVNLNSKLRVLSLLMVLILTSMTLHAQEADSGRCSDLETGRSPFSSDDCLSPTQLRRRGSSMADGYSSASFSIHRQPKATIEDGARCAVTGCCILTTLCCLRVWGYLAARSDYKQD